MKAVRLHDPLDLRYEAVPMASEPGPDEVRIEVSFAGICGSDIHNFKTGQWITRKPSIAGHEFAGVVDAVGIDVEGYAIGDKVVADSRYYCGTCSKCRDGHAHLCENLGFIGESIDGGFAEYTTLPARLLLKCQSGTRLDIAALAEPLAVSLHALHRMNIPDDEPLLIIGCGPIGALSAVASSHMSNRPLLVCDINDVRSAKTAELSGAETIELSRFKQSQSASGIPVRYVLDTTGNVGIIDSLFQFMSGSTIGLVGIGSGSINLDPVHLVEREISILGCHAFTDELPTALRMLETASERFQDVIGDKVSLEETISSYEMIASGKSESIKTMISIGSISQQLESV